MRGENDYAVRDEHTSYFTQIIEEERKDSIQKPEEVTLKYDETNADIPIEDWKIYAEKFKKLCLDKGFKIDPSVTSDKGRITRAPNCLNYKTNPPSPTKVISDELPTYVFEEFKQFLGEVDPSVEDILKAASKGLTEEERRMHGLD
ncbi:hypothetical protein EBY67_01280, partial [bacterium]|nr:hypothetical protein [bacterium]